MLAPYYGKRRAEGACEGRRVSTDLGGRRGLVTSTPSFVRIATHTLEAIPLTHGHHEPAVQIEAVRPRVTAPRGREFALLARVPQATEASAALRPQRHGPLHRRRGQSGQYPCFVDPHV